MSKLPTSVLNPQFAVLVVALWVSSISSGRDGQSPDQPPMATIGPAARIFAPPPSHQFPNGQTYVYVVEWHFLTAGIARVKMESSGPQQKVSAIADSLGVVNALYGIHDRFEAYFNPKTFCSQLVTKHTEEGSRHRDTHVQFDYANHKSVLDEKNLKNNQTRHMENDIPECVTDMITGFYYLASQPLQSGSTYTFPVSEGGKTTEVSAKVEGREQIKVPAGRYDALHLVAEPTSGPLKGKTKISVWFSDDEKRVPVQMKSKLGWGTLFFRLQRVEKQ